VAHLLRKHVLKVLAFGIVGLILQAGILLVGVPPECCCASDGELFYVGVSVKEITVTKCVYICMYVCVCVCVCIYVYIYIYI
jgi:hypothetical protein